MHISCGFREVTRGQCMRFPRASTSGRTNKARDENKTKPQGNHAFFKGCIFLAPARNCLCLFQSCLILFGVNDNTQDIFIGNVNKQKKQSKEEAEQNKLDHQYTKGINRVATCM